MVPRKPAIARCHRARDTSGPEESNDVPGAMTIVACVRLGDGERRTCDWTPDARESVSSVAAVNFAWEHAPSSGVDECTAVTCDGKS